MEAMGLMVVVAGLPALALVVELLTRADLRERHHIDHDTYAISMVVSRTIALVMVFLGVLGTLTGWLCHLGVFAQSPAVPLAFFASALLTLLVVHYALGRYQVTAYTDRLLVRPFFGRARTVRYEDIARMGWVAPWWGSRVRDLRVETRQGECVQVWGLLDIDQILLRIDRFDVLEG